MAKERELYKDAWQAYRQSRYRDAALLLLQASDQSRELGNAADWYKYRVWAVESLKFAQQYAKALDLLLEVRMHEPPDRPNFELWIAQQALIEIASVTNPQFERLQTYLKELRQLATRQKAPAADILKLEGDVLHLQGKFKQAIATYEKAWTVNDGNGIVKYASAFDAVDCCLSLGQIKAAQDWHNAGSSTQENFQERLLKAAKMELHIALAIPNWTGLHSLLLQLDDAGAGVQSDDYLNTLHQLGVRVHLLHQEALDPMQPSHPAQQNLLRPLLNRKNVHSQFDYRLLILDFRLAALRFLVGIAAVDDLYYAQPQQMLTQQPVALDQKLYQRRLQRALASCKEAERYGRRIDNLLQCEYRQQEVAKRRQRVQEISEYVSAKGGRPNGN